MDSSLRALFGLQVLLTTVLTRIPDGPQEQSSHFRSRLLVHSALLTK